MNDLESIPMLDTDDENELSDEQREFVDALFDEVSAELEKIDNEGEDAGELRG